MGPDHPSTAKSVNNLAVLYRETGSYVEAEPLFLRALAVNESVLGPDNPSTAASINTLATLYKVEGLYAKAEPLYRQSLAIYEKALGPEHPDTASALNSLSDLYRSQGKYASAEALSRRALSIDEKVLGDHPDTASSLNNLAGLYEEEDQYAKAEPLYERALTILTRVLGVEHPHTASSMSDLGALYKEEGEFTKAEPLLEHSLAILEKSFGAQHAYTATAMVNLATLYQFEGKFAKSEQLFQRALNISERVLGPEHPLTAGALNNLAELYRTEHQFAKAKPLFQRAISIADKSLGPDHPDSTGVRDNLALLEWEVGDKNMARETLTIAWSERLQWLERSLRFGTGPARRNYVERLLEQLSRLIAIQERDLRLRELGLNAILISKNGVLEETAAAITALRQRVDPELRQKLDELDAIHGQRGALLSAGITSNLGELKGRIEDLNNQEDRLTAELTERSMEFRELIATPTIAGLRAKLGSSVLIEMVQYNEFDGPKQGEKQWASRRYGAYVLTANGEILWQDFGPAAAIDVLVKRYRYAMSVPGNQAVAKSTARQLDALVFAPVRAALPEVNDYYVSPDGLLRLFPFASLVDASGVPVIENYRIQTLSTGRDLLRSAPAHSAQPAWVGGLSQFGPRGQGIFFPPIPQAKEEAREVAEIIRPKPQELDDSQMTKQFLTRQLNGPQILHLATHGYYSGTMGGIALKDANLGTQNILNQEEVAGLHLQGTQLVVLSACETGLGEASFADGVIGLQRSLTLAGARAELLTSWPLNDSTTKYLMVAFYHNLFDRKLTKAESLRQAQLDMIHQGLDPYYWAPFVLYGDGGVLGE